MSGLIARRGGADDRLGGVQHQHVEPVAAEQLGLALPARLRDHDLAAIG
jgi:hypothetical protein